jgi:hypothetical protein
MSASKKQIETLLQARRDGLTWQRRASVQSLHVPDVLKKTAVKKPDTETRA